MSKRGVLLLNFGGPGFLREVRPFLYRLFCDPYVLSGIPAPFRQVMAAVIAAARAPESSRCYAAIGGGSPQLHWTKVQAEGLERLLNAGRAAGDEFKVSVGMRSWEPDIRSGLGELRSWGAEELTLLPLYPQYSFTTTRSSLEEARRQLGRMGWKPALSEVAGWPDDPGYITLSRSLLEDTLRQAASAGAEPHVIFSAHSLPLKTVERGDPYRGEVERTVAALSRGLSVPWSLAFQSRAGSMRWLEPYLEDELPRLAAAGARDLVVCPVSFVSDHIETLWELDMLYAGKAAELGFRSYRRVPVFNGDERFFSVLKEVMNDRKA